ncbi:hypothetical protein HOF56_04485 [Candidatus Peribacteria bacterium]|nr:hypothetical protein [Candidatus Peribacteria bacterium]
MSDGSYIRQMELTKAPTAVEKSPQNVPTVKVPKSPAVRNACILVTGSVAAISSIPGFNWITGRSTESAAKPVASDKGENIDVESIAIQWAKDQVEWEKIEDDGQMCRRMLGYDDGQVDIPDVPLPENLERARDNQMQLQKNLRSAIASGNDEQIEETLSAFWENVNNENDGFLVEIEDIEQHLRTSKGMRLVFNDMQETFIALIDFHRSRGNIDGAIQVGESGIELINVDCRSDMTQQKLCLEHAITHLVKALESGNQDDMIEARNKIVHATGLNEQSTEITLKARELDLLATSSMLNKDPDNYDLFTEYRKSWNQARKSVGDWISDEDTLREALYYHVNGDASTAYGLYQNVADDNGDGPEELRKLAKLQSELKEVEQQKISSDIEVVSVSMN